MPPFHIIVLAIICVETILAAPKTDEKKHPSCEEFSHGVTFNDSQALGTWHLLHYKTEQSNGSGDPYCVRFTPTQLEERKNLSEKLEKYVENLNWENLSLKMEIPCDSSKSNKTRNYFLERLGGDGSYRTLQLPSPTAATNQVDLAEYHRYPMRLKTIEGQYLGMMDCHEKFVFILGKQPPEGKELDEHLKKMIDIYWPDEL